MIGPWRELDAHRRRIAWQGGPWLDPPRRSHMGRWLVLYLIGLGVLAWVVSHHLYGF